MKMNENISIYIDNDFEDVLWLKIFIYTSFRLPDCSLQRVVISTRWQPKARINKYFQPENIFKIIMFNPGRTSNVFKFI